MNELKKYATYIGYVGCLLLSIGVFLPFVSVNYIIENYNIRLIQVGGEIILLLSVTTSVLIFFKKGKVTLISTILSLILLLYDMFNIGMMDEYSEYINYNLGLYFMFIGIILCIIYAFTFKKCLIVTQANESKHSTSNNALNKTFKHCPNCGKKSPASADVCYKCGKQLK